MAALSSTPMLTAVVLCFLLFVPLAHSGSGGASGAPTTAAVDDLCQGVGSMRRGGYGYHISREQCVSALCHDPSSPCAAARDTPSLAALAARLTVANATTAREFMKATLASYPDPDDDDEIANTTAAEMVSKAALRSCIELYTRAVPALEWAARSVAAGRYSGALEVTNATYFIMVGCESMYYDDKRQIAVSKVNGAFALMAAVASSVLKFLLMNTTLLA